MPHKAFWLSRLPNISLGSEPGCYGLFEETGNYYCPEEDEWQMGTRELAGDEPDGAADR